MNKVLSLHTAGNLLLIALGLLAIFHILILFRIVPSDIVWGGQIGDSPANLLTLEIAALVITAIFAAIVATKLGYILAGRFNRAVTVGLWILFVYMLLNTAGNLASGVLVENLIFTPITIILAFCALRLALAR